MKYSDGHYLLAFESSEKMSRYFCKILNNVDDMIMPKKFPPMALNQGKTLFNKKAVTDIKLSAKEITASFKETLTYTTVLKLDESGNMQMSCGCGLSPYCQHEAALAFHIKMNLQKLDEDFCDTIMADTTDPFNRTLVHLKKLSESSASFYGSKAVNYLSLNNGLVSSFRGMIEIGHKMTYNLFYHLFFNYNLCQFGSAYQENTWKELCEMFISLIFKATDTDFASYSPQYAVIIFEQLMAFLRMAGQRVTDKEKERKLVSFIGIVFRQVSASDGFSSDAEREEAEDALLDLKAKNIEQFEDDETYLNFLKTVTAVNENLESKYLFALYRCKRYEEIIDFADKADQPSFTAQLLMHLINFDRLKVSPNDFAKMVLKAFRDKANYENFQRIRKTVNEECLALLKNDLLKYARKYDVSDYLEMEIFFDPGKGYQVAMAEGVLEFNRHVKHFIGKKDDEMIYFYQEQLVPILVKIKSESKHFWECISALDALKQMKGGKYIIFSILRLTQAANNENEFIQYELSSYVSNLDL